MVSTNRGFRERWKGQRENGFEEEKEKREVLDLRVQNTRGG